VTGTAIADHARDYLQVVGCGDWCDEARKDAMIDRRGSRRIRGLAVIIGVLGVGVIGPRTSAAQSTASGSSQSSQLAFETRAQLQAAARAAESEHRTTEASLLLTRLQNGDFQVGDRIVLSLDVATATGTDPRGPGLTGGGDTVLVRAGKLIQFTKIPNIPDLSLDGVLRSELADAVTAHLRKYLRNPTIRVVPLVQLEVLGAVGKPGWYWTRTDEVLSDVIMKAGGVTAESDVPNTVVRRAGKVIWNQADLRSALSDGLSLDQLHLRAGDEIYVAAKRHWSLANTVQLVSGLLGAVVAFRAFR
jgi:hypothetical protein